jgi:hypothetical protein
MTVIEATSGPSVLANVVAAEIVLAAGGSKMTPEATPKNTRVVAVVPLVLGLKADVARSTPVPVIYARVVECDAVVEVVVCVVVAIDIVIS